MYVVGAFSNRMINFLSPELQPRVTSDAIFDDDYSPENLISDNVRKSNLGFMAYCVVKPPVNIDFELPCHANIQSVKVWTKVNSLKSTGFEILAKKSVNEEYIKIGQCSNLLNGEDGAIFLQQHTNSADAPSNLKLLNFFRSFYITTRHTKWLRIRITDTSRCVPVLRRVEVWGSVSRTETNTIRRKVLDLCRRVEANDEPLPSSAESTECSSRSEQIIDSITIPEDFLDSITCDIMAMPMVLPSGKIIDRLTLEKHNQHEEKWGRAPSDPYTGQGFTAERKPVLNAALKAQIDKFLLDHSNANEFRHTSRTVGSVCRASTKRRVEADGEATATTSESCRKRPNTCTTAYTSVDLSAANTLDESLKLALQHITRYSTKTEKSNPNDKCLCCKIYFSDKNVFYRIKSCGHILCTHCLNANGKDTCYCGKKFLNSAVERYHKSLLG